MVGYFDQSVTCSVGSAALLAGKPQDSLGDDVLVHLGGAAGDGVRAHGDAVAAPFAGVRVGPEHVARDFADVLRALAPDELGEAALGSHVAAVHRTRERAVG